MATGEKKKKKIDVEMVDPSPEPPQQRRKKKKSRAPEVNVDNPSPDDPSSGNPGEERLDLPKTKRRKLGAEAIELTGLEVYWKLPSLDPAERQAAALALVRELQAAQQTFEAVDGRVESGAERILLGEEHSGGALKSCAPELQYALPRLVRGVGSSNQCARQGFAAALSTAIHALPSITGDMVLNLIDKEIEVSSVMKGQDIKDGLLGRLFAYASIVRADRLIQNGMTEEQQKLAKHVAENLLTLGFKKTFLREPAASIFLDLSERLASSSLQKSVFTLPNFLEWLNASPEVGGADALLVALKLWRKLPDSLSSKCRMLPKSGSLEHLVQASHLDVLIPYLKESSSSHPRLHLVWNALADIFLDQGLVRTRQKKSKQKNNLASKEHSLITFWTRVVDESLLDSSHERKFLAMRLVLLFLSKLPISCTPIILSASFGRCLLDILSGQDNVLHSAAQQFVSDLSAWAEEDQDRLVLTIGFLQQSSSGKFDHLTKSSTVKQLLGKVISEESCLLAIQNFQRLFVSDAINATDESDDAQRMVASKKIWMVELMCSFSKQAISVSKSMSAAKEVTRFLAAHIFLNSDAVNTDKVKALIKCASGDVSNAEKDEYIGKLRSLLSEKSPRSKDDDVHEDLSYDIVEFFRNAWKKPDKGTVQRSLRDAIFQISSAIKKEESRNKKLEAMRSFLSQLFIQSHLEPGSMDDIVNELLICCNKAFGKVVDVSSDEMEDEEEAPSMGDVLLDIILSVLSQSPAPIRAAAEQMFGLFCGEITSSGLSSLLKVISKQTGHTRQEPLFDIQVDDDEDVLSVEEVTDNEASEVSDPEEDPETGGTDGKQQTDGAMDDAELSDMDDDAMFRMDVHLAQILKAKRSGEPDTQAQLVQFKFRVLGLLDTFLQKQSESVAVLTVLPTLFQSYLDALSDGHKQLSDRIGGVLNRLLKAKNYPKGSEVDMGAVKDLLQKLVILAAKTTDQKLRGLSQGFVFWLLKVSQATCGAADEEVVKTMLAALDDIFQKKKNTLPLSFLRDAAMRYPWLRGVSIGKLLNKCKDGRTDYEKAEAMELSTSVLKHYTKSGSKPSGSNETSSMAGDIEPHLPLLSELLILYLAKPLKKAKQASFLRFCVAWLEALPVLFPGRPLSKLVDTAALSSALNDYVFSGNAKATKTKLESLLSQDRRK
ncbi:hypothetical protein SELMODRAFT_438609 [Selaginella moellendorffii]|uniref:DNA polymerase V n=1 Tax=Selaginella moellendorffii TaxID=88036 RepID=D8QX14_SELML|nr:DNA polymerase V [Selaginella moellendorffii]EFJ35736.1 hypothetical protein SELMODRAFT_438609 [Selaginella moellendorffii]|eukprot:XP_002963865.1 DNA polymerase V [Selaginella moellendorffii]